MTEITESRNHGMSTINYSLFLSHSPLHFVICWWNSNWLLWQETESKRDRKRKREREHDSNTWLNCNCNCPLYTTNLFIFNRVVDVDVRIVLQNHLRTTTWPQSASFSTFFWRFFLSFGLCVLQSGWGASHKCILLLNGNAELKTIWKNTKWGKLLKIESL